MKKIITLCIFLAVACTAPAAVNPKKKPAAKPAANSGQLTIPKDATPNPDGTYSWTDKAGKQWIYSKTPFGISKTEDMGAGPAALASQPKDSFIKATDSGDSVKFERKTPFGVTKWERKKSELTDDERRVFEQQTAKPAQNPE